MQRLEWISLRAAIVVLCLLAVATAGSKRKTGEVTSESFRDNHYGFALAKSEHWKFAEINDETPDKLLFLRFVLNQKNAVIPTEWRDNQDLYTTPLLGLVVDTSAMPLEAYAAQMSAKTKRPSRKELSKLFSPLTKGNFVEQGPIQVDGMPGVVQQYREEFEVQLKVKSSGLYKSLEDALLGDLYIIKRGDLVYLFYFRCERPVYRNTREEVRNMIMTMDFDPPADSTSSTTP